MSFLDPVFFLTGVLRLVSLGLASKIIEIYSLEKSQIKELSVKSYAYILLSSGIETL